MLTRLVMPHGGYGLGNDLIPWAKGFILAEETGARLLHPAWGNNSREYGAYFGTSRLDWQFYRVLVRVLPHYVFTEQDYREIGEDDFAISSRIFAERNGLHAKSAFIVTITGHWGAFSGLENARHFVRNTLGNTRNTQKNMLWVGKQLVRERLTVTVHIRRGDFHPPAAGNEYENVLNTAVPLSWYRDVCGSLVQALGADHLQFIVSSDGTRTELGGFIDEFRCIFTSTLPYPDCSDLLTLSGGDLIICSPSTYSIWAAFLSEEPYVWFAPQLETLPGGMGHRWIRSLGMPRNPDALAERGSGMSRCVPIGVGGEIPSRLVELLRRRLSMKQAGTDLVRGGLVPKGDHVPAVPVRGLK